MIKCESCFIKSRRGVCVKNVTLAWQAVTGLRIGQIAHGLGPRDFGGPAQLFPIMTQY